MGILAWWAAVVVLGWLAVPAAAVLCAGFPDRGVALGKPLALVAFAYVSWLLRSAGVSRVPALVFAFVGLAGLAIAYRTRITRRHLREVVRHEALFVLAFAFFAGVRCLQAGILGGEKFMDFAFLNALLRAEVLPPEDPWLSGFPLNYYYFGHLLIANVTSLSGVSPGLGYNLGLATVGAVAFTLSAAIGRALTDHFGLGLLGGAATVVLGNLDAARQLLGEHTGLVGFDYFRSSRVVPHTITEFPFFSLLFGDLHAHVLALIPTSLLLAVGVGGWEDETAATGVRMLRVGALALAVATLLLANPWNVPLCLVFIALVQLGAIPAGAVRPSRLAWASFTIIAPAACAVVLALPFTLHFSPPFQGFGWVHDATPIANLLIMFGLLLLPALVFTVNRVGAWTYGSGRAAPIALGMGGLLAVVGWRQGATFFATALIALTAVATLAGPWRGTRRAIPLAFIATAAIAIALADVVFVREPSPPAFYRQNTVFKLYFEAWVLLAVSLPAFVRRRTAEAGSVPAIGAPLLALGVAASLCYPVAALATRTRSNGFRPELDGMRGFARAHADDAAAIAWLNDAVTGRPVVLEATGEPYSYFARVSSATGLPTVLGWLNHERVWRADQALFAARVSDIETMYGGDDVGAVTSLLRRYRVRYVFVGELERSRFSPAQLDKFTQHPELFTPVFTSGRTTVFSVTAGVGDKPL